MQITHELQSLLLRLKQIIPPDKQQEFAGRIRRRIEDLEMDPLVGYTIAGAIFGSICELLPLDTITGVDDWVPIGASLGAYVGYCRNTKERQLRQQVVRLIEQEVQHALAH